jgi:WD40 repeat protein
MALGMEPKRHDASEQWERSKGRFVETEGAFSTGVSEAKLTSKVKTLEDGSSAYSMAPVHHLEHREPIDSMAWSPDGKTLVTAAFNKLYLWNTEVSRVFAPHMREG